MAVTHGRTSRARSWWRPLDFSAIICRMTDAANPLSFNAWVTQIALLVPVTVVQTSGVNQFTDTNLNTAIPSILNYAELRCARDMDFLSSQASNTYTLTAGQNVFQIPFDDFFTVQTLEVAQILNGQTLTSTPLLAVSKEFIQNVYGGLGASGQPAYFAMYGDTFGGNQETNNNVLLGPTPGFGYTVRVTGTQRTPSIFNYASSGLADTAYTYISAYLPDLLIQASMIYVAGNYQKNFSATSDSQDAPLNYEKQYQILRAGALPEENRRKQQGRDWTSYSTPVSATQT